MLFPNDDTPIGSTTCCCDSIHDHVPEALRILRLFQLGFFIRGGELAAYSEQLRSISPFMKADIDN